MQAPKQRKILFIAINSSWSQSNLALYYLRQMLHNLPYKAEIQDFTLKDHLSDVLGQIFQAQAEILCFSAYIWNRLFIVNLIPELKKLLPQAIFVVGGPEAANADFSLVEVDFTIIGSGEGVFGKLAAQGFFLSQGPERKGIANEPGKTTILEGSSSPIPLRDIPFPYVAEDKNILQGKLVYYETYRGCPYSCVYCLSASDQRKELRFDPESSVDMKRLYTELEFLVEMQPKTLKFIDRSFNLFPSLAHAIWRFFIESACGFDVHFEIYPDLLKEEDFTLLEKAPEGRIRFEVGIQTTNDSVSQNCSRNTSWEKAKQALQQLKDRTRIRIHADLIAGLPGENYASVLNSINELCAVLPDAVQLGTLKILPDTPMQAIAKQRAYLWLNNPPYQCLASDALSYKEMNQLESWARLLNLYWNKEEFAPQWKQMLAKHKTSEILEALQEKHKNLGYELHSLSKGKREAVMAEMYGSFS